MHDPLARSIAAEGYRVITLDLLGHGRSDRAAGRGSTRWWRSPRTDAAAS